MDAIVRCEPLKVQEDLDNSENTWSVNASLDRSLASKEPSVAFSQISDISCRRTASVSFVEATVSTNVAAIEVDDEISRQEKELCDLDDAILEADTDLFSDEMKHEEILKIEEAQQRVLKEEIGNLKRKNSLQEDRIRFYESRRTEVSQLHDQLKTTCNNFQDLNKALVEEVDQLHEKTARIKATLHDCKKKLEKGNPESEKKGTVSRGIDFERKRRNIMVTLMYRSQSLQSRTRNLLYGNKSLGPKAGSLEYLIEEAKKESRILSELVEGVQAEKQVHHSWRRGNLKVVSEEFLPTEHETSDADMRIC